MSKRENKQPVAIVLGGTNPHIALIENLKNRWYYTILLDYYENPPAKEFAHEHIQESTLDREKVLQIAIQKDAKLVISTCIDQTNVVACYVAEQLGLSAPYSLTKAKNISDKTLMKRIMSENGIPTSKFFTIKKPDELFNKDYILPVVVKPADSNSSKGVRKANNLNELKIFLKKALLISRTKKAIIEEFVEGDEIGVDCFVENGKSHIITMHRKRKPPSNAEDVIYSIGSFSPPTISQHASSKLQEVANNIARVFELDNTPLLIQAIVNGNDVNIVEFAPRIGGGLNFRKIQLFADFDIIDAAVDSFLGVRVQPKYKSPSFFYSENHIYTEPGVFGHASGYQPLLDNNIIEEIYFNKKKGMEINTEMASSSRSGSFIVKAESIDELTHKIRTAIDMIEVYDIDGRKIMKKEIYKDLLI